MMGRMRLLLLLLLLLLLMANALEDNNVLLQPLLEVTGLLADYSQHNRGSKERSICQYRHEEVRAG